MRDVPADVLREADRDVADRWTANLHPDPERMLESHRALLRTLCAYRTWRSWYVRWPEEQIRTPWAYADLWAAGTDPWRAVSATPTRAIRASARP